MYLFYIFIHVYFYYTLLYYTFYIHFHISYCRVFYVYGYVYTIFTLKIVDICCMYTCILMFSYLIFLTLSLTDPVPILNKEDLIHLNSR